MVRVLVFAGVLLMGLDLRFAPEKNWHWIADVLWIIFIALCASMATCGRSGEANRS